MGRKLKYDNATEEEIQFCLNNCPHANAKDCRWTPKDCMRGRDKRVYTINPNLKWGEVTELLMSKDWSNYTQKEIAIEIASTPGAVKSAIARIKRLKGYTVPHLNGRKTKGRK